MSHNLSLLTEDSKAIAKIPTQLENLILTLCDKEESLEARRRDLFVAAVIAIMIDKEFVAHVQDSTDDLSRLTQNWKRPDSCYEIKFRLVQFLDHFVKLVITPLCDTMLVNIILIDINNDVYSKCLQLSQYVVTSNATHLNIYSNLSQLAHILQSTIIGPAKSQITRHYGYESASLMGIPREVLLQIFMFIDVKDIVNIIRTCRDMQWIKSDHVLWRALLLRDYSKVLFPVPDDLDYMKVYIETQQKTEDQRLRQLISSDSRIGYMNDFMEYSDYISNMERYYDYDIEN